MLGWPGPGVCLKHFEQLGTTEIAEVLGLSRAGAGGCYLRAILERIPGFEASWAGEPGRSL